MEQQHFKPSPNHPARAKIENAKIPIMPGSNNKPCLLLHRLGSLGDTEEVAHLLERMQQPLLAGLGVSGIGKSLLSLEVLCKRFGLIFTTVPSVNPGSMDLKSVFIDAVINSESRTHAVYHTKCLLLNRLLILSELLKNPQPPTPKEWLLLQLFPQDLFGADIFHKLLRSLQHAKEGPVDTHIRNIFLRAVREPAS